MSIPPLVTVAVPSFNQGKYLDKALASLIEQDFPIEIFVADAGSTDETISIIDKWSPRLSGWRSHSDNGQAAAINECIAKGTAPYVCWINSDDWMLPGSLATLCNVLDQNDQAAAAYGRCWNYHEASGFRSPVWVEPFDIHRLATRCFISQPGTLIRRSAWESICGVNENLHMAMDYDLWWRLYKSFGPLLFIDDFIAVNRIHKDTKTNTQRQLHYKEAISVVRYHYGRVPLKWWLYQPYSIWLRWAIARF